MIPTVPLILRDVLYYLLHSTYQLKLAIIAACVLSREAPTVVWPLCRAVCGGERERDNAGVHVHEPLPEQATPGDHERACPVRLATLLFDKNRDYKRH